jgi:hypothetical protein
MLSDDPMDFTQIKSKLNSFLLFVTVFYLFLLSSCGGGNSSSDSSSPTTGVLAFNVVYHGAAGKLEPQTAVIDCAGQGVALIEAAVYDPDNAYLAGGGPWNCDVGQGTIASVPAGSGRSVAILGTDAAGNVVFRGQKSGINVVAGSQNNAGTIECYAFVPSLQAPADQAAVEPDAIVLEWADISGATEYRVVVYENSDLNDPVIEYPTPRRT